MGTAISAVTTALLCAGLTGCAALAPVVLPQLALTAGVAGLSGVACATDPHCEGAPNPCFAPDRKDIEVSESSAITIPADEGRVVSFAPAYWQSPFDTAGSSRTPRPAEAMPGTFVVTDKSALFVPPAGTEGVRLPLAGIEDVRVQRDSSATPRQLTVESCSGRLDRFVFGTPGQPGRSDSEATAVAAAEIKARVASARAPKQK
jgi:hypothetical protein